MDLVASCKNKLASFRIKELKDILTQLGVSKQGKKQDLVDRILSVLSEEQASKVWTKKKTTGREEVAKLVDDIYRKLQGSVANDLASRGQGASDSSNVKIKGEIDDSFQSNVKVCCPCGSFLETESMIKCENTGCNAWQHIRCVIIPEKPMEGSTIPKSFYCELCRLKRSDPFLVTMVHPLSPVKLLATNIPTDGSNPQQSVQRTFQITRADKDLLAKQEYDVQAWCMLLNDKVKFRMHWPQYADLQVNGVPVRAINRPGSQLLGANGRDDGPMITPCIKDGLNNISLTGCDARVFCFGVRIVKRRTVQQVLKLIPKEADGEHFEDALARVCRCVGGGNGNDDADSDSDIEVVADCFTINLRCPMSGSRMKIAGRFKPCAHMGCFDLEVFVELNQRSKKWQCPICLKNYSLENIIIDPYFNRITSKMRDCGEDFTELEVKPDGSWRAKCKNELDRRELKDLAEWHLPDGTLSHPINEVKQKVQALGPVKLEGTTENHSGLKLGIKKNPNGLWEVSIPKETCIPSSNIHLQEKLAYRGQKVIPMSSSASGNGGRDVEDPSVNQGGDVMFDFANNGIELDSMCLNIDSPFGFSDRNQSAPKEKAEVIVLSDSDEENDMLLSSGPSYKNRQTNDRVTFPITSSGITDSYPDNSILGNTGANSCLDPYNGNEEFRIPFWQMPSGTQGGPGFQFFASDAEVSDALVDLQHGSGNCEPSTNGYTNGSETAMGMTHLVQDSVGPFAKDIHNNGFVDYPFVFGEDGDPSLQIFLPTRPPMDESAFSDVRDQADMSSGLRTDDWISLRLGDGTGASNGESSIANGFITHQQMPSNIFGTIPSTELNTNQHLPSIGFNTGQHVPGLNTSQQMPSAGFDTRQVSPSLEMVSSQSLLSGEAPSLPGTNDPGHEKASRQSPENNNPFTFPRQKRSVRPRLHLSVDSGSE